jgi:hypothetical protein
VLIGAAHIGLQYEALYCIMVEGEQYLLDTGIGHSCRTVTLVIKLRPITIAALILGVLRILHCGKDVRCDAVVGHRVRAGLD